MTTKFRIREENKGNAYLNIYEHDNNKFSYEITFETGSEGITHSISKQYENGFECCIDGYKELSGLNNDNTKQKL